MAYYWYLISAEIVYMKLITTMNRFTWGKFPFIILIAGLSGTLFCLGILMLSPAELKSTTHLIDSHSGFHWISSITGPVVLCNFIGIFEIVASFAIIAGNFIPEFGLFGCVLSLITFFVEAIILFLESCTIIRTDGILNPTADGILICKNIVILGASLCVLLHFRRNAKARHV
jgi:hypothetical protein